mmetsp:Transcript_14517/g.14125  ORF Transcript_14517/g.14125 Transcript_14517/m.14125 type:complete len:109 (-) Transcript_14517:246-572(-)|eukprot:CAMPEP_0170548218 /NCGR_PEP_ID=MMETSP0211-20121228/6547_1 /TAXON_ID=311385 /ORGANISM="Pseudokeronopsis sp., Strain OXSARD2" /LENGTH=108 /DNA_ID=CAMNT_0010853643 /DNA_START=372 /DNA_END=698 /DNA_ORIENTATION=+
MKLTGNFKQILQDHQEIVKKQEAKKERLVGKTNTKNGNGNGNSFGRAQTNQKIRILPSHYSNGITYSKVDGNEDGNGDITMQMKQDTYHESRLSSIQNIEKILYDISS